MKQKNKNQKKGTATNNITAEVTKQHEYAQQMRADSEESQEGQQAYLKKMKDANQEFDLVMTDAFVRGIRDIGYKSTGTAHNELVDNSIQAGASRVDVLFHHEGDRNKHTYPEAIAVVDNGHGMEPDMIRAAMRWGGTHREGNREGLGRYGFGLKSACVSFALRFTVYSKQKDGEWHAVELDVEQVAQGHYTNKAGMVLVPPAEKKAPPSWIDSKLVKGLKSGTIVVTDKIEVKRLTRKGIHALKDHMLENFGLVYRNYLGSLDILVDGTEVQGVDPLFLRSDCKFYEIEGNSYPAEAIPPISLAVKDDKKKKIIGNITVRFAKLHPKSFWASDEKETPYNPRFKIRRENNGLIICRAGRQLDVTTRVEKDNAGKRMAFGNDKRYCGIEIDFTPTLDELFSVTTSKQQVVLGEEVWQMLRSNGFFEAVSDMQQSFVKHRKALKTENEDGTNSEIRPSEAVMEDVVKFAPPGPNAVTNAMIEEAQKNFEEEAKKKATKVSVPTEEMKKVLVAEAEGRPWKVQLEETHGGGFYRVRKIGGQTNLYINSEHPFYNEVYAASDTSSRLRYALEVLLFTYGECELTSSPNTKLVYEQERARWSTALSQGLQRLSEWRVENDDDLDDLQETDTPETVASE